MAFVGNGYHFAAIDLDFEAEEAKYERLNPPFVSAQEFAECNEPGAEPLLGTTDDNVIPVGGDVMLYGDGGASKTTLAVDLACHLAAGDDWLGLEVPKPRRVLMIENEGPRPMFRGKVGRKLASWRGSDLGFRFQVWQQPWREFVFPMDRGLGDVVGHYEIDVLIAGPLRTVGWEEAGTLGQVDEFMCRVDQFRRYTGRPLTVVMGHHENRGGKVSGAFEGAVDTLLHAAVHAQGTTRLEIQKARWAGNWHKRTLELGWTEGEGFELLGAEERDYIAEIVDLLSDGSWRTAKEIARTKADGGIGANVDTVKEIVEESELFASRTGNAAKVLGRHPTATVYGLREKVTQVTLPESPDSSRGVAERVTRVTLPEGESPSPSHHPPADSDLRVSSAERGRQ